MADAAQPLWHPIYGWLPPGSLLGGTPVDWRCPDCGCRTFARVDERKPDGKFAPGPQIRCVSCKRVYAAPLPPTPTERGRD